MQQYDVIVIGGGQAGLAMGYYLRQAGHRFLILEASERAVGSWGKYYDSLNLFSPAYYSSLPGLKMPGDPQHYPSRDEVIAYFENYAAHFDLPIKTQARVQQVTKSDDTFTIRTNNDIYQAQVVVAASGSFSRPNMPHYPDQDLFTGQILHSSQYKNAKPFKGQRVIVVGAGNSAIQIAYDLSPHAETTIASQEPLRFRQQITLGKDLHWWMKWTGIDYFPTILWTKFVTRLILGAGVLDTGKYQAAVAQNKPDQRRMYSRFTAKGVVWDDGTEEEIDALIYATGFAPNVNYLAELGALEDSGNPYHFQGVSTRVDGLYYMGLSNQTSIASATIRGVGRDGRFIINRINRYLAGKACCPQETARQWVLQLAAD